MVLVASRIQHPRIVTPGSLRLCEGLSLLGREVRGRLFLHCVQYMPLSPLRLCVQETWGPRHGICWVTQAPLCAQWVRGDPLAQATSEGPRRSRAGRRGARLWSRASGESLSQCCALSRLHVQDVDR